MKHLKYKHFTQQDLNTKYLAYNLTGHEAQIIGFVQAHVVFAYWKHCPLLVVIDLATIVLCIN